MDLLLNGLKKIGEFMGLYTPDALHSMEPCVSDESKAEAKAKFSFFTNTEKDIVADIQEKKAIHDAEHGENSFVLGYEDNEAEQEDY